MKKLNYVLCLFAFGMLSFTFLHAQTGVFGDGSSGFNCGGLGCFPQPNYGADANNTTGDVFLLKKEYTNPAGNYFNKIIRYSSTGTRLGEVLLRNVDYKKIIAESNTGTGVFVFFTVGDSVVVERYNQTTLVKDFSTGIYTGVSSVEAAAIMIAHGCLYIASNDINGLHIRRLDKATGTIISSVDYNTTFASSEHALDMDATSTGIVLAGYLDRPGTTAGDEFWAVKFAVNLTFSWQKRYNSNLSLTNNSDRASHVHVSNNTIYLCGTVTRSTGDVDAILWKYSDAGTSIWYKILNKGPNDTGVNCSIDNSNNDVYLLQNAYIGSVAKIFVTRYLSTGALQWTKNYVSVDPVATSNTFGHSIFADPNPGGGGCEIYVAGHQSDYGSDPHGYVDGINYVAYKYNRSGIFTSLVSGNVGSSLLSPFVSLKQGTYLPDYIGGPRLILLGDGDWSNPSPGFYGWNMTVYDISSVARLTSGNNNEGNSTHENNIIIVPNPAKEYAKITSEISIDAVRIFNLTGQLVMELNPMATEVNLNTNSLNNGIYVIQIIAGNKTNVKRLVIE